MNTFAEKMPGVYRIDHVSEPSRHIRSGVPVFGGFYNASSVSMPTDAIAVNSYNEFLRIFGMAPLQGFLSEAISGFFLNCPAELDPVCYVVMTANSSPPEATFEKMLQAMADVEDADIVCVPDLTSNFCAAGKVTSFQQRLLEWCDGQYNRFCILDSLPQLTVAEVICQRNELKGDNGALYYAWGLRQVSETLSAAIPLCGHIAGIFTRCDRQYGSYRSPANEAVIGVDKPEFPIEINELGVLNSIGINCLRVQCGKGIRLWGARTLRTITAASTGYIAERRLCITLMRWIRSAMADVAFEPNTRALQANIRRRLTNFLSELYRDGVFAGTSPEQAFYVKCDAENNPLERYEAGTVCAEIGIAPSTPAEYIVIHFRFSSDAAVVDVESVGEPPQAPSKFKFVASVPDIIVIDAIEPQRIGGENLDETVILKNIGNVSVDMDGWILHDSKWHSFVFPAYFRLQPGASVAVRSGKGEDSETVLFWNRTTPVWNNDHDTITIRQKNGLLVQSKNYDLNRSIR